MNRLIHPLILFALVTPSWVYAETTRLGYTPPAPIFSTENMLQIVSSLFLVLIVIGGLAWILKRFGIGTATSSGPIKVIATAGVGQRERVVLIEIEHTRLVLGVAPGHINVLHCLNKTKEELSNSPLSELKTHEFSGKLDQSIKKTND